MKLEPKNLYLTKIVFKIEGKILKKKNREFVVSRSALQ